MSVSRARDAGPWGDGPGPGSEARMTTRTRTFPGRRRRRGLARIGMRIGVAAALIGVMATSAGAAGPDVIGTARSLDGRGNNPINGNRGATNVEYRRQTPARYADGRGAPLTGPSPRRISNRVFNDVAQNLFSENRVSQWGFVWGQFLDHTFGLRATAGGTESTPLAFDPADPLEEFRNDFGSIGFTRTPAAPGTGTSSFNRREQINTVDSFIDASSVYGNSASRLEWLREGPVDGNMANNGPHLLLPGGDLPTVGTRGNPATAPPVDRDGRLLGEPNRARVAGDVRANENLGLQATHNLFALEHNRIVDRLPASLSSEEKFQIARRIVGAEQQFITYTEFLPALGVNLSSYRGYNRFIDPTLSNEFATVGYRAHSMIHGELEPGGELADFTQAELDAIEAEGIEVVVEGDEVEFVIPLNVAFFHPDLMNQIGLGAVLRGIGGESQYKNDEQIDNQLRSVLFQVPRPGVPDPSVCLDGPSLPDCFQGVVDLGAIDVARGRDHGMPRYNDLRDALGLARKPSFTSITGEATASFPTNDPQVDRTNPIDDPDILDFVQLRDINGNVIPLGTEAADADAVTGIRRTTLAARLSALHGGNVNQLDAFTGMLSERHVPGSEFGELQLRLWRNEFGRLRDGDRFFYLNDPVLAQIRTTYGIDFRRTLSQVIVDNTELVTGDIEANVFLAPSD